jgi:hypothetical protein
VTINHHKPLDLGLWNPPSVHPKTAFLVVHPKKKIIENVLNLYATPVNLILAGEIPPRKVRKKHA